MNVIPSLRVCGDSYVAEQIWLSLDKQANYRTLFYYQLMHTTLKNAELLKHSTQTLLTKRVIFSQALTLAP